MSIKNLKIREAAKENGVKLWQIGVRLGISDGHLSRKLRFELPEQEQDKILTIIDDIAKERKAAS